MNFNSQPIGSLIRGLLVSVLAFLAASTPGQSASLQAGEYYQESSNKTASAPPVAGACNAISFCYILFTKVPAGKRLIVTHVSCNLSVTSLTAEPISAILGARRSTTAVERFQVLPPSIYPSNTPGYTLVINTPTLQLYEAGDRPEISTSYKAAASTTGFCNIAGQMTDVP